MGAMQGCRLHGCPNGGRAPTGALRARRNDSPQSLTGQGFQRESAALAFTKPLRDKGLRGFKTAVFRAFSFSDSRPAGHYRNFHGVGGLCHRYVIGLCHRDDIRPCGLLSDATATRTAGARPATSGALQKLCGECEEPPPSGQGLRRRVGAGGSVQRHPQLVCVGAEDCHRHGLFRLERLHLFAVHDCLRLSELARQETPQAVVNGALATGLDTQHDLRDAVTTLTLAEQASLSLNHIHAVPWQLSEDDVTTLGHGEPDRRRDDIRNHDVQLACLPCVHGALLLGGGHGAVDAPDPQTLLHEVSGDGLTDIGVVAHHQHWVVLALFGGLHRQLNLSDDGLNLRLTSETAKFGNTGESLHLHHALSLLGTTGVHQPLLEVLFGTLVVTSLLARQLGVATDASEVRQVGDDIGGEHTVSPTSDWVEHLGVQLLRVRLTTGTVGTCDWGEVIQPCLSVCGLLVNGVGTECVETLHEVVEPDTGLGERCARQEPLGHERPFCAQVSERTTTTSTTAGDTLTLVNDESVNAPTEVAGEVVGDDAVAELVKCVLVIPCEPLVTADEPAVVSVESTIGDDENLRIGETCVLGTSDVQRGTLVDDGRGHLGSPLVELLHPVESERWWADDQHLTSTVSQCGLGEHDARDGLACALFVSDEEVTLLRGSADNLNLMWHQVLVEDGLHVSHGFP